ncbi:hypothetical protein [Aureliella helgolandensis]|uniref:Uncharacterized protein n=1 Tax=Aureliella helgolandensis TaxID=2527968 RepID=A0A518GGK2_9BACT|nr:hypothetical protein [Aureliella helgolandensis]QDV27703.1 hypothetical protein Q31a_60960 [Aureliella helgolandensis]
MLTSPSNLRRMINNKLRNRSLSAWLNLTGFGRCSGVAEVAEIPRSLLVPLKRASETCGSATATGFGFGFEDTDFEDTDFEAPAATAFPVAGFTVDLPLAGLLFLVAEAEALVPLVAAATTLLLDLLLPDALEADVVLEAAVGEADFLTADFTAAPFCLPATPFLVVALVVGLVATDLVTAVLVAGDLDFTTLAAVARAGAAFGEEDFPTGFFLVVAFLTADGLTAAARPLTFATTFFPAVRVPALTELERPAPAVVFVVDFLATFFVPSLPAERDDALEADDLEDVFLLVGLFLELKAVIPSNQGGKFRRRW